MGLSIPLGVLEGGVMSMRSTRIAVFLAAAFGILAASGCGKKQDQAAASATPSFLEIRVPRRPPPSAESVARGHSLYEANCIQCHGARGAGDGFGAPFLVPPPRDFTTAAFKFRTTGSGELPTDEDLFRTISRGANGTGMPPWQYLLTAEERWVLVDYVKSFSPAFSQRAAPEPLKLPAPPKKAPDPEQGKLLYAKLQCAKCHGEDGRGAGPSAQTLTDVKGFHVNSRDFTNPGSFRTGWTAREIVRTFETGMNGAPMPSYAGLMTPREEYDLAAYVLSLSGSGPGNQRRQTAHGMEGLGKPDRVIALREHAWKYEPSEIHVKKGEVVRVDFSTTDNGLGAGHGFALDGFDQTVFINGAMVGAPLSVTFKVDQPGRYKYYCATQCSTSELHPHMMGVLVVE
jgi:mono/diheme cytochrome c family protein